MKKLLDNYGIFWVLIGLCGFFSLMTLKQQTPSGTAAVGEVEKSVLNGYAKDASVIVVGATNQGSADFAKKLTE